jgi:hypothetical protein
VKPGHRQKSGRESDIELFECGQFAVEDGKLGFHATDDRRQELLDGPELCPNNGRRIEFRGAGRFEINLLRVEQRADDRLAFGALLSAVAGLELSKTSREMPPVGRQRFKPGLPVGLVPAGLARRAGGLSRHRAGLC